MHACHGMHASCMHTRKRNKKGPFPNLINWPCSWRVCQADGWAIQFMLPSNDAPKMKPAHTQPEAVWRASVERRID
jgi:hypothetical protein